jgi:hypothetical protein
MFSTIVSLHAATRLFTHAEIGEAIQRHPRNRALLEAVGPELQSLVQRVEHLDIPHRRHTS